MGRPRLGRDKSGGNKKYIKRHRNKNAEKYKQEDRERKKLARQKLKCLNCPICLSNGFMTPVLTCILNIRSRN